MEIRVARSIAEVEAIREIWSSWKTHRDSDIDHCLEHVWKSEDFIRPHVIVLYRDGRPDAALVGRLESSRIDLRLGYLRFASVPIRLLSFSYDGFLGSATTENSGDLVRSIMSTLRHGEADAALFHQLGTDSPLYQKALALPGIASRDHLLRPTSHHFMRLPGSVDEMYRELSQGLRAEIRRKKKKILAEFGDRVSVQCFRDPADVEAQFPALEEIAKKTYQRALGVGFRDDEPMRRRFRVGARKGWLRIYLMTINRKPCAFWTGSLYEGTFCSEEVGFDPQYSEFSPGTFLLATVVEDLCNAGTAQIDFGFGEAEYKGRFGNVHLTESWVYIFAPGWKGLTLNALRTWTRLVESTARRALGSMGLTSKLKKMWRSRSAEKNVNE